MKFETITIISLDIYIIWSSIYINYIFKIIITSIYYNIYIKI
jgi:hypothetical protein